MPTSFPQLTAEEAAELIRNNDTMGLSGFTPAGAPKRVPRAIAERANLFHARGEPFTVNIMTGGIYRPVCRRRARGSRRHRMAYALPV